MLIYKFYILEQFYIFTHNFFLKDKGTFLIVFNVILSAVSKSEGCPVIWNCSQREYNSFKNL